MARLEPIPTWALALDDDRARAAIFDWLQRLNDSVEDSLTLQNEAGCIFEYSSSSVCKLNPTRSGTVPVYIDGKLRFVDVPSTGVSFSNTGLSALTLYYAYAYWTGTTLAGEFSTTGHADSNGVETKSDDQTRTLVGMVYTGGLTPGNFQDSVTARLVRTWYNDPGVFGFKAFGSNYTTTSASYVELSSSERSSFIAWDGEVISASHHATVQNSGAAGTVVYSALGLNGIVYSQSLISTKAATYADNVATAWEIVVSPSATPAFSEGDLLYFSIFGAVSAGTGTWSSGLTAASFNTKGRP